MRVILFAGGFRNMKKLLILAGMLLAIGAANAAVEKTFSLKESARSYLEGVLSQEWKTAKSTERCGVTKLTGARYKYSCVFQLETEHAGAAYAVLFDEAMQLVAVVKGEGKLVGKKMQYSFGIKDGIGFTEIKEQARAGIEVNK
jgi:hypothetical protein